MPSTHRNRSKGLDPSPEALDFHSAASELRRHADPARAAVHRGYFKHSGEDVFLGVTTPLIRQVARKHGALPLSDVRKLIASGVHDERSLGIMILVLKFQKCDEGGRKRIFDFYMKHRKAIKDWDEVDGSAPYIVGPYLMDRDKAVLYQLIRSTRLWDRRIALVSTLPMIRKGLVSDALALVERVIGDEEDLIHKAAGWMLREVGKKNLPALCRFLDQHCAEMPRTMLRYAIERFSPAERTRYMKKR